MRLIIGPMLELQLLNKETVTHDSTLS